MSVTSFLISKLHGAIRARIRLFGCVDLHAFVTVLFVGELFWAVVACVRSSGCVGSDVHMFLAAMRFILGMSFNMLKEFSFPFKLFGALITFKLFLPRVCSDMGIHIALFVEGF